MKQDKFALIAVCIVVPLTVVVLFITTIMTYMDAKPPVKLNFKPVTETYLLPDAAVLSQVMNWEDTKTYLTSYPNSYLNTYEMREIFDVSEASILSKLFIFTTIEFESSIIRNNVKDHRYAFRYNRLMSYGMHLTDVINGKKVYRYGTFNKQLHNAVKRMEELYKQWSPGKAIYVKDLKREVVPENAATWLCYKYRPFYNDHDYYNWGVKIGGNKTFVSVYKSMYNDWLKQKQIN